MTQAAKEKINELHKGKVVRIFKKGWFYKIAAMETMAAIVMIPEPRPNESVLIEQIEMTGHCTITQAELLIEHLYNNNN